MSFHLNRAAVGGQPLFPFNQSSKQPIYRTLMSCALAPLLLTTPLVARAHSSQTAPAGAASTSVPVDSAAAPVSSPDVSAATPPPAAGSDTLALPEGVSANASNDQYLLPGTTEQNYTLQQAVDTSLSTPLTALRLRLIHDEAFRSLQLARANLSPQVRLVSSIRAADSGSISNSDVDNIQSNDLFRLGAEATYPLLNHGSTIDQLHIAQENLVAADADVVQRRRTIVDASIGSFYDLVAAQRDVHDRDLAVEALQEQVQAAQSRYNLGTVTKGDVLQAQSALDTAIADQSASQLRLQQFRATFAAILGKDPETVSPIALEPQQAPALSESASTVLHRTLAADPRVTALEAQTAVANNTLAYDQAVHKVTIGLVVGGGIRVHNLTNDSNVQPYYDVFVNVGLPILDTTAYRNTIARDKDQIQLDDLDQDQYNLTAKATDLGDTLAYQSAVARIAPATAAVASAEEAYRLREQQYTIGTATQENVVASYSILLTHRTDLENVLAERDLAIRRLLLNEGTVDIQSLDNFPAGNGAAAVPTDTGAAAATANGGTTTSASNSAAAATPSVPATVPPSVPVPVSGTGASATPATGGAGSADSSNPAVPASAAQSHHTRQ